MKSSIQRLEGMRDLAEEDLLRLRSAVDSLRGLFSLYGYRPIDTPFLEETELFLRKSGGEMGARLYTFTEPGGHRVTLRPEFTSSIIRRFIRYEENQPLPARWQYAGPVFRYDPLEEGAYRQFTQVGAELLGASEPEADAEIITMAWYGVKELGISGHRLHVGHLGAINDLLKEYGLSERAKDFLIASIQLSAKEDGLSEVIGRGRELGLLVPEGRQEREAVVGELDSESARALLQSFLQESASASVGQRTPEEVFDRFIRKVRGTDSPARVEEALEVLTQLAKVKGTPGESLREARSIAKSYGLKRSPFDKVEGLVQMLQDSGLDTSDMNLDFGLARGIAYYSGVVFEVLPRASSDGVSLGGGGRYDGLIRSLGGKKETAALGFAYNVERLLQISDTQTQWIGQDESKPLLLVPTSSEAYLWVLQMAREMRSNNQRVQVEFRSRRIEEQIEYARSLDLEGVIEVDETGLAKEHQVRVEA